MPLLSLEEISRELCVSCEFIKKLIDRKIIIPYGGSARLGEPRFSTRTISNLREKVRNFSQI